MALAASAAPPRLDALFPAGAQRGEATPIIAVGEFKDWPPQVWIRGAGIAVRAGDEKGELRLQAAENAEPGVHWLRLFNHEGPSGTAPLVIGVLPELNEREPNDEPAGESPLPLPLTMNGRLEGRGDVNIFPVALAEGQTLIASLDANRHLASPMDGVLQVASVDGFVLAQNDDGRGLDPQIVFSSPRGGTFLVRVFAFPATPDSTIGFAGGNDFVYRLTLTTGQLLDHSLPMAVASSGVTELQLFDRASSSDPTRVPGRRPASREK